jgi:hypothetical protein
MDDASLNMMFSHAVGPDGRVWVSCTIMASPYANFTFGVPADKTLDFVRQFSEQMRACQAEASRMAKGLIVATDVLPTELTRGR